MYAGIFSTDAVAIAEFIRVVEAHAQSTGAAQPQLILFPQNSPRVAVAVEHRQNRPVMSATRRDGSFAVVAGEIYNMDEFISPERSKDGYPPDDASMILDRYFASGPDALAKINGAVIVTIWDAGKRTLTIWRDRWGQMSQFYSENSERLLWAADLRTLLALGVPPEIDSDALDFFLAAGYFPAPWSGLINVGKIPPAATICNVVRFHVS